MTGTELNSPTPPDGPPREPVDPRPLHDPNPGPDPTPIDTPRAPNPRKIMRGFTPSPLEAELARLMGLAATQL